LSAPPARVFDLSQASAALYSRWARIYLAALAAVIALLSLPTVVRISQLLLRGGSLSSSATAVYLAILFAAYPSVGFLVWLTVSGMALRPVRMTLSGDSIILESRAGRRSVLRWTSPRFRMTLVDQSDYAAKSRGDSSLGYRIDGFPTFKAALTREAFEALLGEAGARGMLVTSGPPSRWSAEAGTRSTVVYNVRGASSFAP
jgi:hypothetical protein